MSAEAFDSLPDMLDELPPPGAKVSIGGGELRTAGNGPHDVPLHYFPFIFRMWETFAKCGWGPHDSYRYDDVFTGRFNDEPRSASSIARFTNRECKHWLTKIYWLEERVPGAWEEAFHMGLFHAVARQLMFLAGGDKRVAGSRPSSAQIIEKQ